MNQRIVEMFVIQAAEQAEQTGRFLSNEERLRYSGRACTFCGALLTPPRSWGERYCDRCPPHEAKLVRIEFHYCQGWNCDTYDAGSGSPLSVRLRFTDSQRLYLLAKRGRALVGRRAKETFYHGVGKGSGTVSLTLTDVQYRALLCACSKCEAKNTTN
jgi:hypothetical protein